MTMRRSTRGVELGTVLGLAMVFAFSTIALAEDEDDRRGAAAWSRAPSRGPFVGAVAGIARGDDFIASNNDGSLAGISADKSDTAWTVFGGYSFGYFGVEAGYRDFGSQSFTATSDGSGDSWAEGPVGTEIDQDGWYFGVNGQYPIAPRWTLFASVGILRWKTTETFTEPFGKSVDEDSGSSMTVAAGVEYDLGQEEKWSLRAQASRDELDNDGNVVMSAGAGAVYRF